MRPLWRNALWLIFAAACGAVGYWQGIGKGAEVMSTLYTTDRISLHIMNARQALMQLARGDETGRAYAESNLHLALAGIGDWSSQGVWHKCSALDRRTLATAALYLKGHPVDSPSKQSIRHAFDWCPAGGKDPVPPIISGEYRFEIRDPEFPDAPGIEALATIDTKDAIVLETVKDSSRFPAGTRFEGKLAWNAPTKQWVFAARPADANAKEVGGCSDGPEVIDLEHFVLWFC
jgi:hypothetical protein